MRTRKRKPRRRRNRSSVRIPVKHKDLLEVPKGKSIRQLPLRHFVKLAKKKGYAKVSRGLTNLQVWNKNRSPGLSKWAKRMRERLSDAMGRKKRKSRKRRVRRKSRAKSRTRRQQWPRGLDQLARAQALVRAVGGAAADAEGAGRLPDARCSAARPRAVCQPAGRLHGHGKLGSPGRRRVDATTAPNFWAALRFFRTH